MKADQLLPAALIGVTNGGPVEHAGGPRRPLAGVAPTGRELAVAGITIYRTSDGRIAEAWSSYDELGMLEQLGIAVFGGGGDGDGDGDDMTRTPLSA